MKDNETADKIQDIQILEQNLQSLTMQKQSFQMELNEIINALAEFTKAGDEIYRILGGIMMRADKNSLNSELEDKKKVLEIRISSIEKQEKILEKKTGDLREEISKAITDDKPKH